MEGRVIILPIRGSTFRGDEAEALIYDARDHGRGTVTLEPDNKNQHDRHAVKILIDGMHVGYVPRENAPDVRQWLKAGAVRSVTVVPRWDIQIEVEGV